MPYIINKQTGKKVEIDPITGQPIQVEQSGMDINKQFQPEEKKSIGGFAGNILESGVGVAKDIGSAAINVLNPDLEKNTIANLARIGIGAAELTVPGEQGAEKYARNVGKFYDERYGISNLIKGDLEGFAEKAGKTIYEDPVGFALDASIVLGGTGTALKGVGAATKSSKLARAGKFATVAGETIDPLRAAGRLSGLTKTGEKVGKVGETVEAAGKRQGLKAIKAAPVTDIANFYDDIGRQLDDFQAANKLYGTPEQIIQKTDDLIKANQKEYNALVRSGEKVPVKDFTNMLRKKAADMKVDNLSPEIDATANALIDKAKSIEKLAGKEELVSIDKIVDVKGSSFQKVNPTTMRDAAALNADKIAGGIGIEYLDNFAEGSAAIGKELQALQAFKKIVKKRAGRGAGAQAVKLGDLTSAIAGGTGGLMFSGGNPALAAVGGIGVPVARQFINSPKGASLISKAEQTAGKVIQSSPETVSRVGGQVVPKAAVASRVAPAPAFSNGQSAFSSISGQTETPQTTTTPTTPATTPQIGSGEVTGGVSAPQPQQGQTATGFTLQELSRLMTLAVLQGSKEAQKQAQALYEIEADYQKSLGGGEMTEKQTLFSSAGQAATGALQLLNQGGIKTGFGQGAIGAAGETLGFNTEQQTTYRSNIAYARTLVKNALLGGAITPTEAESLQAFIPEYSDAPNVAKTKLENFVRLTQQFAQQKTQPTLMFSGGQQAVQ